MDLSRDKKIPAAYCRREAGYSVFMFSEVIVQAGAGGPAGIGVGFRQAEGGGTQFAESKAAGTVEHDVAERVADPSAQRAEPGVGELPRRKGFFGAARLDVAFGAKHPRTGLPVV